MIIYPPENFDENEIFILVTLVIVWFFIFMLKRHLTPVEIVLIWTLNIYFAFTADMTLGVEPLNLYSSNDTLKFEIFDFILFFIGYPPFAYLAANYYKPRSFSRSGTILFVIICALFTTFFEWLSLFYDVFTFKGWKSYMSIPVYIIVYGLSIWLLNYIQKKKQCPSQQRS
ncbi:hypothetical protein LGQ02_01540 [Bacillus shivajii]|uniref:hypothetical protein n=1 Tax=Bacillus shivajii TaxID=1983719 RepID=UPI001CFA4DFA|nr:hypothetical protein [Bacillus shivajii]UCZ53511.1 hypothetical protein LGQ02_01540 [Bacillus shivajii]